MVLHCLYFLNWLELPDLQFVLTGFCLIPSPGFPQILQDSSSVTVENLKSQLLTQACTFGVKLSLAVLWSFYRIQPPSSTCSWEFFTSSLTIAALFLDLTSSLHPNTANANIVSLSRTSMVCSYYKFYYALVPKLIGSDWLMVPGSSPD